MGIRRIQFYLIAFAAATALHGQTLFEGASGFGDGALKGRPKIVKVERETLGDKPVRLPEEESSYREDGKLSSHKRFVDGKLVATESFEYDTKGDRIAITTRDAEDKVTHTQSFHRLPDQSEEEIDAAGGKQLSRTVRRFDTGGRVIETKSIDEANVATIMQTDYDDRGRPVEARVRMEGENLFAIEGAPNGVSHAASKPVGEQMMRVAIAYQGDNQAVITVYDGSAQILLQLQTTEDALGNEMAQILFEQVPQGKPANSARVEHTDIKGNWTLKTLLERDPRTLVEEPIARLHRSIIYY